MRRIFSGRTLIPMTALAFGAAALAAPQAAHAATGGGCSGWVNAGNGMSIQSCIYEDSHHNVVALANYRGNSQDVGCDTQLRLRDDTSGWSGGNEDTVDCSQRSFVVTATRGHHYHAYGVVTTYIVFPHGGEFGTNIPNSPELTAS